MSREFPQYQQALTAILAEEHRHLAAGIVDLATICPLKTPGLDCQGCSSEQAMICSDQLNGLLTKIRAYMSDHFRREEQLMLDSGYGNATEDAFGQHVAEHWRIVQLVEVQVARRESVEVRRQIAETHLRLMDWLVNHTDAHDAVFDGWLGLPVEEGTAAS